MVIVGHIRDSAVISIALISGAVRYPLTESASSCAHSAFVRRPCLEWSTFDWLAYATPLLYYVSLL